MKILKKYSKKEYEPSEYYATQEKLYQLFSLALLVKLSLEDNETSVMCY